MEGSDEFKYQPDHIRILRILSHRNGPTGFIEIWSDGVEAWRQGAQYWEEPNSSTIAWRLKQLVYLGLVHRVGCLDQVERYAISRRGLDVLAENYQIANDLVKSSYLTLRRIGWWLVIISALALSFYGGQVIYMAVKS